MEAWGSGMGEGGATDCSGGECAGRLRNRGRRRWAEELHRTQQAQNIWSQMTGRPRDLAQLLRCGRRQGQAGMLKAPADTGLDCLTGVPAGEGRPRLTARDARGCCPLPTAWGVTVLEPVLGQAHPGGKAGVAVPFPALAGRRPLT